MKVQTIWCVFKENWPYGFYSCEEFAVLVKHTLEAEGHMNVRLCEGEIDPGLTKETEVNTAPSVTPQISIGDIVDAWFGEFARKLPMSESKLMKMANTDELTVRLNKFLDAKNSKTAESSLCSHYPLPFAK